MIARCTPVRLADPAPSKCATLATLAPPLSGKGGADLPLYTKRKTLVRHPRHPISHPYAHARTHAHTRAEISTGRKRVARVARVARGRSNNPAAQRGIT